MLKINQVVNNTIDVEFIDMAENMQIDITDFELNQETFFLYTPDLRQDNTKYGFAMWGPLEYQQLWKSYMNNVMSLAEVQTEATNRSISTSGKTQDDLAKEIVEYECDQHSTEYLL